MTIFCMVTHKPVPDFPVVEKKNAKIAELLFRRSLSFSRFLLLKSQGQTSNTLFIHRLPALIRGQLLLKTHYYLF